MVPLASTAWAQLSHAYGSAADIPALLEQARTDTRRGSGQGTTWFKLWSALCHQGDSYTASYAALPHLVALAQLPAYKDRYDPILLAGCIELARLEGTGDPMPDELRLDYEVSIRRAAEIARDALRTAVDEDSTMAYAGSLAALEGDAVKARKVLDADLEDQST